MRSDPALTEALLAPLAARRDDEVATVTVLAALAARLAGIVGRYRRAGLSVDDLATVEADLVAETVAALAAFGTGDSVGGLVSTAWGRARTLRRRDRRRAEHPPMLAPPGAGGDPLAGVTLGAAVRAARVPASGRSALWLAAMGVPTEAVAAAAGVTPAAIRARRSRAARRLGAWVVG
ncbi:MAG: hypothetical protein ACRDY0_13125 [Acidimicrobiales bacterium]